MCSCGPLIIPHAAARLLLLWASAAPQPPDALGRHPCSGVGWGLHAAADLVLVSGNNMMLASLSGHISGSIRQQGGVASGSIRQSMM